MATCASAQYGGYTRSRNNPTAIVVMSVDLSSNATSTGISVSPSRKQLGNFGTGCSGGVVQPSGDPTGQLWATSSIKTSAEAAGCATRGVVTTTASGTGIQAVDNGHGAGGSDSVTAQTNQYGTTTYDTICSGDPHANDPTLFPGLSPAGCATSATAFFSQTTSSSHPNTSMLWPSDYGTNSTTLDSANWFMRSFYFMTPDASKIWDNEHDVNYNSSPTAYAQSGCSSGSVTNPCGYFGWGFHWGRGLLMWAYCPQGCSGWKKFLFKDMRGGTDLSTWTPTSNHWYHVIMYGHRDPGCSYGDSSNCYWYDYFTLYDVTAGQTPVTYRSIDATTGGNAGGIPVNHSSWTAGPDVQVQLDQVSSTAGTASIYIVSDITKVFKLQ